jgi:hypothetical protein
MYDRLYAIPPSYSRLFSSITYISVFGLNTSNVTYSTSEILTKTNDLTTHPLPKF